MDDPIVIVGAARTPMGAFMGDAESARRAELGPPRSAPPSSGGLARQDIDEVLMGYVLPAGQGQAPARQAALGAGLPVATGCTTINKMCGSGMKAVMLAHDAPARGHATTSWSRAAWRA